MKRFFLTVAAALLAVTAFSQEKLSYSLPRTSLEFTVSALRSDFTAGPYAAYAKKYLGLEARTADETSFTVTEVRVRSFVEADPTVRLTYIPDAKGAPALLQLTSQGLVAGASGAFTVDSGWKFPAEAKHDFLVRPENLTRCEGTLYSAENKAVRQQVVVARSTEEKAAEVAKRIFDIREQKYNILVGDTDATYSGEAMKTAVDELEAIEAELLSLFVGSCSTSVQQAVFEVIPAKGQEDIVAFRLSPTAGLVAADDYSGSPYFVQLVPEAPAPAPAKDPAAKKKAKQILRYRVPAVCTLTLGDGVNTLLRQRIPVYQLGTEEEYPIY